MSEHSLRWALWLLLAVSLVACKSQEPDLSATIDALNATIAAQQQQLASAEPGAVQRPSPAGPLPTGARPRRPTVALSTPRPVRTAQRPPTVTPTASPLPTATSTPSATPIPDAAVGRAVTNLREGPGVGYSILAEVDGGTPLQILGKSTDEEWLQVRTPAGLEGWMFYLPVELYIPLESVPASEVQSRAVD